MALGFLFAAHANARDVAKERNRQSVASDMAVSKSLDKGLANCLWQSALIHYQIYRFGSCLLLPFGTIAARMDQCLSLELGASDASAWGGPGRTQTADVFGR